MDIIRRNTDYAFRIMSNLANNFNGELMSARQLAGEGNFSYQLGCKLLQRLRAAKLVESHIGPKGGFSLSRKPSKVSLLEVIEAIQGPVRLNRCLLGADGCEFEAECEISVKLGYLQRYIDGYLGGITLDELVLSRRTEKEQKNSKRFRNKEI